MSITTLSVAAVVRPTIHTISHLLVKSS